MRDLQGVLAVALGLPEFVPLENDPFQQVLRQRDLTVPAAGYGGEGEGEGDEDMEPASGTATPSLVSDASAAGDTAEDDAMSVDSAVATPSEVIEADDDLDDENDEDDEDGVDFEEVLPAASSFPSRTATTSSSLLPDAYADPPAADGSFELHFTGIPPPTLQDGELSLAGGQTPFVAQQRGFDPDEEYPLSEEEGEPIIEGDEDGHEREDGLSDETRRRLEGVFGRTLALLRELRAAAEAAAAT